MYITSRKRERKMSLKWLEICISQSLSPESFVTPPWPWKQQITSAIPSFLRKIICLVCLGQEKNPDQTVQYLNFRQTICRIFLFFSSQTYIILYTTDSAILPDKKGEKRKLTMPELHADDEIRSSNNMHIYSHRQPTKGSKLLHCFAVMTKNQAQVQVIHQKLKLKFFPCVMLGTTE